MYDLSRKLFLMLYFINWPNFNVWLSLLLEILSNMSIVIVYLPGCDVINFEINLNFLIKLFFYKTKKSRQNLNILRTRRSFKVKQKVFFIIFKGLSVAKNCLRPDSAPLYSLIYKNGPFLKVKICSPTCQVSKFQSDLLFFWELRTLFDISFSKFFDSRDVGKDI